MFVAVLLILSDHRTNRCPVAEGHRAVGAAAREGLRESVQGTSQHWFSLISFMSTRPNSQFIAAHQNFILTINDIFLFLFYFSEKM